VFGKQKQKTETIQKTKLKAMKTTNNAQKTENRKFENSISKTFAVIVSLVLISFTVSANGFWKQLLVNNAYGKMAILMEDQQNEEIHNLANSEGTNASTDLFYLNTAMDKSLVIENWMTDDANFNASTLAEQTETDKSLTLESWMIENPNFEVNEITKDNEPALEVEPWMTNNSIWSNN
jgi:hypothetical protein